MTLLSPPNISILLLLMLLPAWAFCLDLKENIIINGNFSNPILTWQNTLFKDYEIQGWSCTRYCQISNCANFQKANVDKKVIYNDCEGQVIDLNSRNINQLVTQIIQAKAGNYLLSFDYFFPIYRANKKTMLVYFNDQLVFKKWPNVYNQFQKYSFETEVNAFQGANNLTLTMEGYLGDGSGFNVNNVSLRMIYSHSFEQMINDTFKNSVVQGLFSVPAQRAFLGEVLSFFASLDRWQFYGYHKRKHSHNEGIFLQNINDLMNIKGTLLKAFFDRYLSFPAALSAFFTSLNFKGSYTDIAFLTVSKDNSFLSNNSEIFIYSLPNALASWLLLLVLFRLTYQRKVSKLLRKYSLCAVALFLVFEGNMQQFAFYLFEQFGLFFAASFAHRLLNCILAFFCFLLLFASVASFLCLKWHYQRLSVYFTEEYGIHLRGILCCTLDRGMMCFAFGFVNSFLIDRPQAQLIALISLELLWMLLRTFYASSESLKSGLFIWIQIVSGFNRALFLSCSLVFQRWPISLINDQLHKNIIIVFLVIWFIKFLINLKQIASLINSIFHDLDIAQNPPQRKQKKLLKSKSEINFKTYFKNQNYPIYKVSTVLRVHKFKHRNNQKMPKSIF